MTSDSYEEKLATARTLILSWGKKENPTFPLREVMELLLTVQCENDTDLTRDFRAICAHSLELQCRYDIPSRRSRELSMILSQAVEKSCA